jgi:hypothetical protein
MNTSSRLVDISLARTRTLRSTDLPIESLVSMAFVESLLVTQEAERYDFRAFLK